MISRISVTHGLLVAVTLQTIALVWMVVDRSLILKQGAEIRLKVQPVDPRDLFRGDFVILNYEISWLGPKVTKKNHIYQRNDIIYVGLRKQPDGLWNAVSAYPTYPSDDRQDIIIRGRIKSPKALWRAPLGSKQSPPCPDPCYGVHVSYGLENYFVPEGEGRSLEKLRNQSKIEVLAAVNTNGHGAIKALIVNGKPAYVEPLL